jgi:hypothetical protein
MSPSRLPVFTVSCFTVNKKAQFQRVDINNPVHTVAFVTT